MMFRVLAAGALTLAGLPVAADDGEASAATETLAVSAYVDAYNARDLEAMIALMHDDVQWLSVEGDTVSVFANGKSNLTEQMRSYISSPIATTSEIDGEATVDGRFVAVREIARWTGQDGALRSQSALAVYEFEDGLIRRVYYYPATR